LGSCRSWQGTQSNLKATRWGFLSDTHVPADRENNYRGFYPYRNLQKVVPQIVRDLPEGLIVTGDLARLEGLPGDYDNARQLLTPILEERPVCVGLGNHDHRGNFLAAFGSADAGQQAVQGKHVIVLDSGPVRFLVLDSLLYVDKVAGLLGRDQRHWLADYLKTHDNKPTILCFHHTLGDGDGDLLDAPRFFDIVKPAKAVKALVFGHSHAYSFSEIEGIHLINLPACGYNFGDKQPVGWVEAQLTAHTGEFLVHAIAGNMEMDGRTKRVSWR
jgi:Icc protein